MIFNKLYERDIDLLIIEEFLCNKEFAKLFTDKAGIKSDYVQCSAHHSQYNRFGESDITFVLKYENGKEIGIFIEDKINAPSMDGQSQRYIKRAKSLQNEQKIDKWFIFLVAPDQYVKEHKNDPNSNYKLILTYENMVAFFDCCGDIRSLHKKSMLLYAIQKKEKRIHNLDQSVTDFWNDLRSYCNKYYPELELAGKAKTHASNSCWPEFHTNVNGTKIVYKSDKGYVDFQISDYADYIPQLHIKLSSLMQKDMRICRASNSASVRLSDPNWIIDFHSDFNDSIDTVNEVLSAVLRMYCFSLKLSIDEFSKKLP